MVGLANDLNIQAAGYVVHDGAGVFFGRTLTAGSGINITNGTGISGNSVISATAAPSNTIYAYHATAIDYTILATDAIIGVTNTAAPRTIKLPSTMVIGQVFWVKDESGGAAANNITVSGNGNNIDGAASKPIDQNFGAFQIYCSGTAYFIV